MGVRCVKAALETVALFLPRLDAVNAVSADGRPRSVRWTTPAAPAVPPGSAAPRSGSVQRKDSRAERHGVQPPRPLVAAPPGCAAADAVRALRPAAIRCTGV